MERWYVCYNVQYILFTILPRSLSQFSSEPNCACESLKPPLKIDVRISVLFMHQELRLRGESSAEQSSAITQAPTALEERGTGGSGIMSFLKTIRDQTRGTSIPPVPSATHQPGAEVARHNHVTAGTTQKTAVEALISKLTNKLSL